MTTTKNVTKSKKNTKTHYTKDEAIALIQSRIIETETGCHEWQGPRTKDGYGQFGEYWLVEQFGIKLVHRLMVHLATGHVFTSRAEQVMHGCHNRICCNPLHLSVGTAAENMRQASERGSWSSTNCGEANSSAKITVDDVRAIRARRAAGEKPINIARDYPVNPQHISAICRRVTWRHVV